MKENYTQAQLQNDQYLSMITQQQALEERLTSDAKALEAVVATMDDATRAQEEVASLKQALEHHRSTAHGMAQHCADLRENIEVQNQVVFSVSDVNAELLRSQEQLKIIRSSLAELETRHADSELASSSKDAAIVALSAQLKAIKRSEEERKREVHSMESRLRDSVAELKSQNENHRKLLAEKELHVVDLG